MLELDDIFQYWKYSRSVQKSHCCPVGRVGGDLVRCHDIAFTSVEVKDFDSEARPLDNTVDQRLESDLVDFGFHWVDPRAAVLVYWHTKECLVP